MVVSAAPTATTGGVVATAGSVTGQPPYGSPSWSMSHTWPPAPTASGTSGTVVTHSAPIGPTSASLRSSADITGIGRLSSATLNSGDGPNTPSVLACTAKIIELSANAARPPAQHTSG